MVTAIIIDDEELAIKALLWELNKFKEEITVASSFKNPKEALVFLETNTIDCVFLDIQMEQCSGFDFIDQLKQPYPEIIITSAHDDYALKAIKENVLDYLTKPIDSDDLYLAIEKLRKKIFSYQSKDIENFISQLDRSPNNKKIALQSGGKILFIESDAIYYVESDGNYSTVYYKPEKSIVLTKKLKEVQEILPDNEFFRIHNSYIINLNKIKEYHKTDNYIVLDNNKKLPVSRQKKSSFLTKI